MRGLALGWTIIVGLGRIVDDSFWWNAIVEGLYAQSRVHLILFSLAFYLWTVT